MVVHEGYENLNFRSPVVTLGIFDGVHRGHKALLGRLVSYARTGGSESVIVTFYPHPRMVLSHNKRELSFLTSMDEKKRLLESEGINHLVVIEFNTRISKMKACTFIEEVLVKKIRTKHLIVGYNNQFGRYGGENFEDIKQCAESLRLSVEKIESLNTREGAISSSAIREALLTGRLDDANRWLGYDYSLEGKVVAGKHLGKSLGFPTANIEPDYQFKLIPKDGVYAVESHVDGNKYNGMLSIGLNPTINKNSITRTIELNIFEFNGDIYGKKISVVFRHRLRDEKRFDNIDQLIKQMDLDKRHSLELLT